MRGAIILCAGLGSRLGPITADKPKCLIELHGKTILGNLLDALLELNVAKTVLVVGYRKDKIIEYVNSVERFRPLNITFVENKDYKTTNSAYSFLLGSSFLKEMAEILHLHSDMLIKKKILIDLFKHDALNFIGFDGNAKLDSSMQQIQLSHGKISLMVKNPSQNLDGKALGFARLQAELVRSLLKEIDEDIQKNEINHWFYNYLGKAVQRFEIYPAIVPDGSVGEMNTLEDYAYLKETGHWTW